MILFCVLKRNFGFVKSELEVGRSTARMKKTWSMNTYIQLFRLWIQMFRRFNRTALRKDKWVRHLASSVGETMETAAHEVVKWQKYTAGWSTSSQFITFCFRLPFYWFARNGRFVCYGFLVQLPGWIFHSSSSPGANRYGLSACSQQALSMGPLHGLRYVRHGLLEEMQRRREKEGWEERE